MGEGGEGSVVETDPTWAKPIPFLPRGSLAYKRLLGFDPVYTNGEIWELRVNGLQGN
jgi:hypothetical protein